MQIGKYFTLKHSLEKQHFLAFSGPVLLFAIAFYSRHCIFPFLDLVKHDFDLIKQQNL